jgi:hypothetical protein
MASLNELAAGKSHSSNLRHSSKQTRDSNMFTSFLGVLIITFFVFLAVWGAARLTLGR